MKNELRKAREAVLSLAKVVEPFYIIADSIKSMDEAKKDKARCESEEGVQIQEKIFLIRRE